MRDHNYIRDDGTRVPVSQMTDQEIAGVLRDGGVRIHVNDGPPTASEDVIERLKIEVLIRALKL